MKAFFILVGLLTAAVIGKVPHGLESSYTSDYGTFEIRVSWKDVTTYRGRGSLILYSVFLDNKFVHGGESGGRFLSCSQVKPSITPIMHNASQIGWIIEGDGICGNTSSGLFEIVIPRKMADSEWSYTSKSVIGISLPAVISRQDTVEFLYYEQNWGGGGTSTSFYVPRKMQYRIGHYDLLRKGDLYSSVHDLEEMEELYDWSGPSFLGLFVAGIEDLNAPLMNYAMENYYLEDDASFYRLHFEGGSRDYMEELVHKVKGMRELYEEVDSMVKWGIGPIEKI